MSQHLQSAARALRNFLQGFVGIAPVRPLACTKDRGTQRPFCC
jgi:hypothetical protein